MESKGGMARGTYRKRSPETTIAFGHEPVHERLLKLRRPLRKTKIHPLTSVRHECLATGGIRAFHAAPQAFRTDDTQPLAAAAFENRLRMRSKSPSQTSR